MHIARTLALAASLLVPLSAASSAAEILAGGGGGAMALGSHWGPYETYRGVSFRWVDNDAEIVLRGGGGEARVAIACEGGPSLGRASFPLRVLDASRRQVDHVVCDGPDRSAELLLPLGPGETHYFLHADGGGRRVAGVPRVLNFRVFSLDDERGGPSDVVDWRSGVRLGQGWYPLERYRGRTFRWMNDNGRIIVAARRAARGALRLQLEIGPSVGARSAALTVRDRAGNVLLRTTLNGSGTVVVPLALQPGDNEISLGIASANKHVPNDPRILNLRLFSATAQR